MTVRAIAEEFEEVAPPTGLSEDDVAQAWRKLESLAAVQERIAPEAPKVIIKRAMPDREILAAMSGLGAVLAVRVMLALSIAGAFVLFYSAVTNPDIMRLAVAAAYAVLICGPLVWLSTKRT